MMDLWTVYERPTDYPTQFVARRFVVSRGPTTDVIVGATLEEVRAQLPPGLARVPRHTSDEPQIVEVWL